jgi:hypothetical protein
MLSVSNRPPTTARLRGQTDKPALNLTAVFPCFANVMIRSLAGSQGA